MIVDVIFSKKQSNVKSIYRTVDRKRIEVESFAEALKEAQLFFNTFSNPTFLEVPDEVLHLKDIGTSWTPESFPNIKGVLELHGFGMFIIERTDLQVLPPRNEDEPLGRYYTISPLPFGVYRGKATQVLDESLFGWVYAVMDSAKVVLDETNGIEGLIGFEEEKKEFEDLISLGIPFDYESARLERYIEGAGYKTLVLIES